MTYNILFLGQKPIGESCFFSLMDKKKPGFNVCAVISNKNTDKTWWKTNNIYKHALSNSFLFIDNEKRNTESLLRVISEKNVNFIISIQHPWILSKEILESVNYQALNLHMAKIPDYKGWNTFSHAILNQEKEYGVTLHWIAEEVDMGCIALESSFLVEPDETALSLYEKANKESLKIFNKLLYHLENNIVVERKNITSSGHYYGKNSLANLRQILDLTDPNRISEISRAFYFPPFEPAYTIINGQKFYIVPKRENIL
jgi:methionyl-tRNA formyltransferase